MSPKIYLFVHLAILAILYLSLLRIFPQQRYIMYKLLIVPGLYPRLYISIRQSFSHSLSKHFLASAKNIYVLFLYCLWFSIIEFRMIRLSTADLCFLPAVCICDMFSFLFSFCIFNALSYIFETVFTRNIPLWFCWMFSLTPPLWIRFTAVNCHCFGIWFSVLIL